MATVYSTQRTNTDYSGRDEQGRYGEKLVVRDCVLWRIRSIFTSVW